MMFWRNIKKVKITYLMQKIQLDLMWQQKLVGKLLYISGQISIDENGKLIKGKVGKELKYRWWL